MSDTRPNREPDSPLSALEPRGEFVMRHIGPRDEDVAKMLREIGYSTLDELIEATLPPSIRVDEPLDLPPPRSETAPRR